MKSVDAKLKPDHSAIRRVIRSIPPGCVASYGEVAERAGLPRRARLVARVLREAPPSAGLPWYRVLRANGRIAFPAGSRGPDGAPLGEYAFSDFRRTGPLLWLLVAFVLTAAAKCGVGGVW